MIIIERIIRKGHVFISWNFYEITPYPLLIFIEPSFTLCAPRTVAIIIRPPMTSHQRDSVGNTVVFYFCSKNIGIIKDNRSSILHNKFPKIVILCFRDIFLMEKEEYIIGIITSTIKDTGALQLGSCLMEKEEYIIGIITSTIK